MLPNITHNNDSEVLGEDQWRWLEDQVASSDAQVNIVVSSIQVFTTNPAVESWGHFGRERSRLLRTIKHLPGLAILSGDVHHAEFISVGSHKQILEVTSSGLTHSCEGPFYGPLCKPILNSFPSHRLTSQKEEGIGYFLGRNFGTIDIDWEEKEVIFNIHSHDGNIQISTKQRLVENSAFKDMITDIPALAESHEVPIFSFAIMAFFMAIIIKKSFLPGKLLVIFSKKVKGT